MADKEFFMNGRLKELNEAYLKAIPSITVNRAIAYPDIPANLRREKNKNM